MEDVESLPLTSRAVQSERPRRPPPPGRRIAVGLRGWIFGWWALLGFLLAPVLPGGWITVAALAVASAAPLGLVIRSFTGGHYPSAIQRIWVMRPFWYGLLALPLLGVTAMAGAAAGAPFGAAGEAGRWALLMAATVLVAAALAGYVGSRRLTVREFETRHPDLPPGVDGLRIVQLSDLHVGPHTSRRYLARVAQAVERARPELVVITGDQVDDHAEDVAHFAAAFGGLAAPLGVVAVLGNHDVYAGWREVRAGLEASGITVLVNEAVELRRGGGSLWLAGTGDPAGAARTRGGRATAAPDVDRTLAQVPDGAFTVALAHNPVLWPALVRRGVDLTLSGHTHHGQLSIPRLGWSLASPFLRHAMGSHQEGGSLLYINPGTNYWGLPFRLGALPEVTVLTLRRAGTAGRERPTVSQISELRPEAAPTAAGR